MGGARNGLVINGNANQISNMNAVQWVNSVNKTAVTITGDRNVIGNFDLSSNNADNNGVVITGAENRINGRIAGFSAAGRVGVALSGSKNKVSGALVGNATGLNYTAGLNNSADLEVTTNAGQLAVSGSKPGVTDRFSIRSSGAGQPGGTATRVQSATIPMDVTTAQTIVIPHGLLYTPDRQDCALTLLDSSPSSTAYEVAYLRVAGTDATNVTVAVKLRVAGAAGTLARVGLRANV
jgi:hypothetical protein